MTRTLQFYSKSRRASPEAAIQRAVIEHLRMRGVPGMVYMAVKNEGKRSEALGLEYKRQGMRPGAPDLLVMVKGKPVLGLELKTAKGKLSAEQRQFALEWEAAGGVYVPAYGLNEALETLELYGALKPNAIRRARAAA